MVIKNNKNRDGDQPNKKSKKFVVKASLTDFTKMTKDEEEKFSKIISSNCRCKIFLEDNPLQDNEYAKD